MSVESEPLHQTHIDSLSIPNSPELLAGNSEQEKSPVLLERTPTKSRSKSRSVSSHLKRDLLPSLSGRPNLNLRKATMTRIWPQKCLVGRQHLGGKLS